MACPDRPITVVAAGDCIDAVRERFAGIAALALEGRYAVPTAVPAKPVT